MLSKHGRTVIRHANLTNDGRQTMLTVHPADRIVDVAYDNNRAQRRQHPSVDACGGPMILDHKQLSSLSVVSYHANLNSKPRAENSQRPVGV